MNGFIESKRLGVFEILPFHSPERHQKKRAARKALWSKVLFRVLFVLVPFFSTSAFSDVLQKSDGFELTNNSSADPAFFSVSSNRFFFNTLQLKKGQTSLILNGVLVLTVSGDVDKPPMVERRTPVEKGGRYEIYDDASCQCRNVRSLAVKEEKK